MARFLDSDTYGLRYFSSEREVEFCGQATIAIIYGKAVTLEQNGDSVSPKIVKLITKKAQNTKVRVFCGGTGGIIGRIQGEFISDDQQGLSSKQPQESFCRFG